MIRNPKLQDKLKRRYLPTKKDWRKPINKFRTPLRSRGGEWKEGSGRKVEGASAAPLAVSLRFEGSNLALRKIIINGYIIPKKLI